jgi:uncharacterized protein with PQ loop repeat
MMQGAILVIMIFGGIAMVAYCIPPLIKLIKTHRTDSINLTMFCIYLIALLLLITGGIGQAAGKSESRALSITVTITNVLALVVALIIFIIKIKGLVAAKKQHLTEKEYWD